MIPTATSGLPVALLDVLPRMRTSSRFESGRRLLALVAMGRLAQGDDRPDPDQLMLAAREAEAEAEEALHRFDEILAKLNV
ncbi:hypothetical protein EGY25_08820 [Brevundimonas intermedia]|uniref:Uncharacterized protein n=1 Tax=Brevundimonas intermedia TaxID=74315 RepID=A0A4Y9RTB5_9CAUL|nr:hypothetical protein [Brevundimonas intermedia]TFW12142.1 hypothetical protein EGY25_08820 [Brevundimonas intermedia]